MLNENINLYIKELQNNADIMNNIKRMHTELSNNFIKNDK